MSCKSCDSERIMNVYSHSKDLGNYEVEHLELEHQGYAPLIPGICDGDDVSFEVCLDCGIIQGYEPMTDQAIKEAFEG
jgi:hypothetical protein